MKLNHQVLVALAVKPGFEVTFESNRTGGSTPRWIAWKNKWQLKLWILTPILAVSVGAMAQETGPIGGIPSEEDCLAFIAILPTFQSKEMTAYYETNPSASGKDLVGKLQSLANGDDKAAQFTYSMLLRNGYCVPQDMCAARWYLKHSRGGPNNWEQMYPSPPWPLEIEATCS